MPGRAALFWGARNRNELLMPERIEPLVKTVVVTTDDGSVGEQALVTAPLKRFLADHAHLPVYACGSTPMMKAVADVCAEAGARCFVSLETYMACGVGACLGCVVKIRDGEHPEGKFRSVCKDGRSLTRRRWYGKEPRDEQTLPVGEHCRTRTEKPGHDRVGHLRIW